MITTMSLELTRENMILLFPSWEKPLSDKEITDFLETNVPPPTRLWFPDWPKDLLHRVLITPATKKYTTKTQIKQAIKEINDSLDRWVEIKNQANREQNDNTIAYCDLSIEDLLVDKEKLQAKLRYTGVKFANNDLETAKQRPITDYIDFNSAGFAKCLWHTEKTGSLHLIKGKNKAYCFGGCGAKDVIDVVQNLHNCDLPEALKIILNK